MALLTMPSMSQTQQVVLGIAAAASVSALLYWLYSSQKQQPVAAPKKKTVDSPERTTRSIPSEETPVTSNAEPKKPNMSSQIEELDKQGKALFKDKQVRPLQFWSMPSELVSD